MPLIGHTWPWKKSHPFQGCRATTALRRSLLASTRTYYVEHGLYLDILQMIPTFVVSVPMVDINDRFERFLIPYASCDTSGYLSPFWPRKLQKMQNLSKIKTTWHVGLRPSSFAGFLGFQNKLPPTKLIPAYSRSQQKNWPWNFLGHFKYVKKQGALDGAFWPIRTPSIEHNLFLDILQWTPTFESSWTCPW